MGRTGRIKPRPSRGSARILPPEPTADSNGQMPHFSLEHLQAPYAVDNCDQQHQAALAMALWKRSRMTWSEIISAPRHGLGTEMIARSSLRVPVPRGITDDVDFIALRFHGNAPMVGFRVGRVFHVVWLDHDFSVYPHS